MTTPRSSERSSLDALQDCVRHQPQNDLPASHMWGNSVGMAGHHCTPEQFQHMEGPNIVLWNGYLHQPILTIKEDTYVPPMEI